MNKQLIIILSVISITSLFFANHQFINEKLQKNTKTNLKNSSFLINKQTDGEDPNLNYGQAVYLQYADNNGFNIKIYGRLVIPKNASTKNQIPVAIIIAGSGPTTLNGNSLIGGIKTNNYLQLAVELEEQGIATFRYNKRGLIPSYSNQSESQMTFDDFAYDAAYIINYLKKDSRFNSFYIMGHSEGSSLGMLAITKYLQKRQIQGYISLEGAAQNIYDILLYQLKPQYPADVYDEIVLYMDELKMGIKPKQCPLLMAEYDSLCGPAGLFRESILNYMISWLQFYPTETFASMNFLKNLVVQGSTDLQVPLENGYMLHKANDDSELKIFDQMNHILKKAPANREQNLATYYDPTIPLFDGLSQQIAEFILN
ncbi:hypothetical protein PPERSA_10837 [Pseudocohnilembus persalinus]|uniref:Serine aminopeptidase S33 domain-containing protein n=1 Tax=Pseudocohnilembus persalinus TaxID=266149 RepID=A0A0V0QDS6_PSEPJ|nr:hypothetical protein PPERSA_10837 [Pseudocohnilembus persalinus]|eukprot:KRX00338.1 hypothetical protein PPERSA_10837 [Pseudocohnilembus persalinus]